MRADTLAAGAAMVSICLLIACNQRELAATSPRPSLETQKVVELDRNRDMDILFVVDNSRSMRTEQDSLAANFSRIVDALSDDEEGLPSLHIAVVSTDLGAGGAEVGCTAEGDRAVFRGADCPGLSGSFIEDLALEDGTRQRNYSESLADTFSCMARLGDSGCGFEQPLEAMRRALDGSVAENQGFVRQDAYLAIIFITDEDDCSTADRSMFEPNNPQISTYGSHRCFEFGVTCDGPEAIVPGPRENCRPRVGSPYMYDVGPYVDFLRELKGYDERILVAGIVGELEPVEVVIDDMGRSVLAFSCSEEQVGEAVPPIRLAAFMEAFSRSVLTRICDEDLTGAVDEIARFIDAELNPCLEGALYDTDPATPGVQPECTVSEVRALGSDAESETLLPLCDNPADPELSASLPCYLIGESPECAGEPSGLALEVIYPDGYSVAPGARAIARCRGL